MRSTTNLPFVICFNDLLFLLTCYFVLNGHKRDILVIRYKGKMYKSIVIGKRYNYLFHKFSFFFGVDSGSCITNHVKIATIKRYSAAASHPVRPGVCCLEVTSSNPCGKTCVGPKAHRSSFDDN